MSSVDRDEVEYLAKVFGSRILFSGRSVYVDNELVGELGGAYKFIHDDNDSSTTFENQWKKFPRLRHDSYRGDNALESVIKHRTNWDLNSLNGKLVLECGAGAGADSEVLLKYGARLISVDLTTDVLQRNKTNDQIIIQASIDDLPFNKAMFDVVFCHRVIMHTQNPSRTLDHILQFVKPQGAVFVHTYAKNLHQMAQWKYALRPLTTRMNREKLFRIIDTHAANLMNINTLIQRVKPRWLGRLLFRISSRIIPIRNYHLDNNPTLKSFNDAEILDLVVHDTFDALAPKFDSPLSAAQLRAGAIKNNLTNYEIEREKGVTILRTKSLDENKPAGSN